MTHENKYSDRSAKQQLQSAYVDRLWAYSVEEDIVECGATTDPLLKSRQNPQSCGFESTNVIAERCGSPTGEWNDGKRTPSARGGTNALGVAGGRMLVKKQGAMNYLKHANRYGRPQLL